MPVKGNLAFLTYIQIWKQRAGRAFGQVPNPAAPGADVATSAYLLTDPMNLNLPDNANELATFKGGGTILGQMRGALQSLGEITWEQANLDATLRAMANKSNIDTSTVSGWTISGDNENNYEFEQVGMSVHMRYQDRDSGSDGVNKWWNLIIPQGELIIRRPATLGSAGGDNPAPARATFTPSMSTRMPTGVAFSAAQGFKRNIAMAFDAVTTHPLGVACWFADGTETSFDLPYLPIYSTVTTGNLNNWVTKGDAPTAPSSISTSTGAVVIAAAGSSSDAWRVMFPTEFVPAA